MTSMVEYIVSARKPRGNFDAIGTYRATFFSFDNSGYVQAISGGSHTAPCWMALDADGFRFFYAESTFNRYFLTERKA